MKNGACLPDFIGIGAQKAGTTWLGHNLQLHPDVWMPRNRELHYFDDRINDDDKVEDHAGGCIRRVRAPQ